MFGTAFFSRSHFDNSKADLKKQPLRFLSQKQDLLYSQESVEYRRIK